MLFSACLRYERAIPLRVPQNFLPLRCAQLTTGEFVVFRDVTRAGNAHVTAAVSVCTLRPPTERVEVPRGIVVFVNVPAAAQRFIVPDDVRRYLTWRPAQLEGLEPAAILVPR